MLLKIIFKDPYDYFSLMDLKYPQIWYWREDLISLNHLFCQNIKLKYTKYKRARLYSFCKIYIGESLSMFHLSRRVKFNCTNLKLAPRNLLIFQLDRPNLRLWIVAFTNLRDMETYVIEAVDSKTRVKFEVAVLMVFWDCLWMIGLFYS